MYSVHPYTTRKRVHNTKLAQIQVLRVSLRDVTWNLSSGNLTMTVEDQTNAEGQMHFTRKLWWNVTNLHKNSFSRTTLQWFWTIINNFLRSNLILYQPSLPALQHNMQEYFHYMHWIQTYHSIMYNMPKLSFLCTTAKKNRKIDYVQQYFSLIAAF